MPIIDAVGYPIVEDVMNLVRSHINDTFAGATDTPGEGIILTDDATVSPQTLQFLNASIRKIYRELSITGDPRFIKDNVLILDLTPVHGSVGTGIPDPSVQVKIDFTGYYDGTSNFSGQALPNDVMEIERVWERLAGSSDVFEPMIQSQFGLRSRDQYAEFREWESRGDAIWMVGATSNRDIRLRYYAGLNTIAVGSDFSNTSIPVLDSADAIAYTMAAMYASSKGAPQTAFLEAKAAEEIRQLKNRRVRRQQSVNYNRTPYRGGSQ